MYRILLFLLFVSSVAFGQQTDASLTTQSNVIRDETVVGGNTKTRIAAMYKALIDSKVSILAPRLLTTSTIGYVWTATDGSGNGSWQPASSGFTVASLAEAQAGTDNTKGMTPLRVSDVTSRVYNVKSYGAKGDTKAVEDGGITSGTNLLNSATATFVTDDIGKTVEIPGAGAAGVVLVTTITGRNSATQVTVAVNATTTVSSKRIWWGTDDTAAIQATTNACFAAKSKDVYFPIGVYMVAGALVTSDNLGNNPNAQIYIPASPVSAAASSNNTQTIRFIGEGYSDLFGDVINPSGSVIKSTLNQGTGTRPSIIGSVGQSVDNFISKMNYTTFILENMSVMASSNGAVTSPNVIGVNGLDIAHIEARHVSVSMDCNLYAATTDSPSGKGSVGIIAGRRDNNGPNILESVWVTGAWERGFVFGEHTYPNYTWAMGCFTAYTFLNGNFEQIGNIGANTCTNYLEFPNATLFGEAAGDTFVYFRFSFESSGLGSPPPWLAPTNLLVDAGQYGKGLIKYISQNGTDLGNFRAATSNEYGLSIVPIGRDITRKFNTAGGAISSGYGTTVSYGDNSATFELSNSVQQTGTSGEFSNFIQSSKTNLTNGLISQRAVMNNTGSTGLNGDAAEKRVYLEYITNDGATLNGRRYEYMFETSLKQIAEQTGNEQKWFTNGSERFRIASAGQFGLGGANYGTSGQVLTSQGSGSAPIWSSEVDGSVSNELQTITNTSNSTTHTVTLSSTGGSLQLAEGSNITLTTTGTGADGIVTIASTGGGGGLTYAQTKAISMKIR